MRVTVLSSLATAALLLSDPAHAQWHGYVSKEGGFSFSAPGAMKTEKIDYASASSGQRVATLFQSDEDNIEYKVKVIDFTGVSADSNTLIKEASSAFMGENKVLSDVEARVESDYGRKITVDLPNDGGRSMAAVYFKGGHIIQLEATVLPANGDYGTPDMSRFVESIAFGSGRAEPDATELELAH
jgi:hypothetical protein